MARKRLFADMDGTLSRFHDQDMYLERMFEKNFFLDLEPFKNMVTAIRNLVLHHPEVEVYIISAKLSGNSPFCEPEKNAWLDKYLPEIDQNHRIFPEMGRSKAEYVPGGVTKDDYLLDDYNKGLNQFLADGGSAIKVMNNINMRGMGAYGGDKGHMWTGPLVTTETASAIIVGDLLECMGLQRDKHSEMYSLNVFGKYSKGTKTSEVTSLSVPEFSAGIQLPGSMDKTSGFFCASYGDAMKCLDAIRRASTRELDAFSGFCVSLAHSEKSTEKLVIPRWQMHSICTNLNLEPTALLAGVKKETMDRIKQELSNGYKPAYGRLTQQRLASRLGDSMFRTEVFHDPAELTKAYLQAKNNSNVQNACVEWFIEPRADKHLQMDSGEPWTLTDDDALQYRRTLDPLGANDSFELCQIQQLPDGVYDVTHGTVSDLSHMPETQLTEYLNLYGYDSLDDFVKETSPEDDFIYDANGKIDRENSPSWIIDYGLIAEMIFETEFSEYLTDQAPLTWDGAVEKIASITGDTHALDFKETTSKALSQLVAEAQTRQTPSVSQTCGEIERG